jgi:hypothetical protein
VYPWAKSIVLGVQGLVFVLLYQVFLRGITGEKIIKILYVGIAIGDLDSPTSDKFLSKYQILIATAEKVDSLLRNKAHWLIQSLNVIVLDEVHFINDGERGRGGQCCRSHRNLLHRWIRSLDVQQRRFLVGCLTSGLCFHNCRLLSDEGTKEYVKIII